MSETSQLLKDIQGELKLIRRRLEAIEDALSEELSVDDAKALKEAVEEHKRGETIRLEEATRRLT